MYLYYASGASAQLCSRRGEDRVAGELLKSAAPRSGPPARTQQLIYIVRFRSTIDAGAVINVLQINHTCT